MKGAGAAVPVLPRAYKQQRLSSELRRTRRGGRWGSAESEWEKAAACVKFRQVSREVTAGRGLWRQEST